MKKLVPIAIAVILGISAAFLYRWMLVSDKDIIEQRIMEIKALVETKPLPMTFVEQTKLAKKLLNYTTEDIEIYDELQSTENPVASEADSITKYAYVGLRLFEKVDVRINDLNIQVHDETRATSEMAVDYTIYYRINTIVDGIASVRLEWTKQDGQWKIIEGRRQDVFE